MIVKGILFGEILLDWIKWESNTSMREKNVRLMEEFICLMMEGSCFFWALCWALEKLQHNRVGQMKNSNFTCLNEIVWMKLVYPMKYGELFGVSKLSVFLLECIFHFPDHWRPNQDIDFKRKLYNWLQQKIVGLRQLICNSNSSSNFLFLFFVCNPIITMDSIVKYYQEKCTRKFDFLGSSSHEYSPQSQTMYTIIFSFYFFFIHHNI